MCFYRPLNETNEWEPWPLRGAEGRGVEKQLPRVSPEAPALMPSQLGWRPRHMGLGQFPKPRASWFPKGTARGARGSPKQEEVSTALTWDSGARWPHRPAFGPCSVHYSSVCALGGGGGGAQRSKHLAGALEGFLEEGNPAG